MPQSRGIKMSTDALKSKLKELHVALGDAQGSDTELTELLQLLDTDIRAVLNKNATGQAAVPVAGNGLATRTQTISARFAAKHPHLEPVLRELTDMLASLGI